MWRQKDEIGSDPSKCYGIIEIPYLIEKLPWRECLERSKEVETFCVWSLSGNTISSECWRLLISNTKRKRHEKLKQNLTKFVS